MNGMPRRNTVDRWVFLTWWRDLNGSLAGWSRARQLGLLAAAALVGLCARLWAQTAPANYDFNAYVAVSDWILSGGNPYETGKHNYGPVWFLLHSSIRRVLEDPSSFRVGLAVLLARERAAGRSSAVRCAERGSGRSARVPRGVSGFARPLVSRGSAPPFFDK